jgi:alanine racemase
MAVEGTLRPMWAEIDLDALRANAAAISQRVAPAALCAVVKADGYGHGAVRSALAFLEGGAQGLAVAIVDEGVELRQAEITAPILLLSEPAADAFAVCFASGLTPTIATIAGVRYAAEAAKVVGGSQPIHVKVDTGMHRVGVSLEELGALLDEISQHPQLVVEGMYTHFTVADGGSDEDRAYTDLQLQRFDEAIAIASAHGIHPPVLHAANSAGAVGRADARFSMVRAGLVLYGEMPSDATADAATSLAGPLVLAPALTIKARVSAVHDIDAGERPSYGRRRALAKHSRVATVPMGYADGFPRRLFDAGAHVLIGGVRHPLAGSVTMDQIIADCGDHEVAVGDEVVLLGTQGDEVISTSEWAMRLDTITWEVLCGIGPRVHRRYVGEPLKPPGKRRKKWWLPQS